MVDWKKEAAEFFEARYDTVGDWLLRPADKVALGDENNRVCRFCGERSPEVKFDDLAHAIPESMGNKSIKTFYECDTCNHLFGNGIENDFGNWSKPMRTMARIRGKNGVPTLAREGKNRFRIDYEQQTGFQIKSYEENPIHTIDEVAKSLTLTMHRDTYTPVAVLKAFVKMGLTLMPEEEMPNFVAAKDWIMKTDHTVGLVTEGNFPLLYTFVRGSMPNDEIKITLLRRKANIDDVPYAFLVLGYGNESFQVPLPSQERDGSIHGKQITLRYYPYPSADRQTGHAVLDMSGRFPVKGDTAKATLGFEHMEHNP